MFAAALAVLIAQTPPSPDAIATLSPDAHIIRRMPASQPRIRRGDVVIRDSGSTNFRGYTLVVHSDFSADVDDAQGTARRTTLNAPQAKWLFAKIREAMPLDALPVRMCVKSASFGNALNISYGGVTTPDLSCGGDAVVRELARTVAVIRAQAGVTAFPGRSLLH